jgi:choline dehydrogenase
VSSVALAARGRRAGARSDDSGEFDYIVVGAGSSGCVIASRLSADPAVSVLLIEAGSLPVHPAASVPGKWTALLGSDLDWKYTTEPAAEVRDRRIAWPRGRALGGSSAINALSYARGHQLSFDAWAMAAGAAWSYRELLPIFRMSERNTRGASDYHGDAGPLVVASTTDPHAGHLAFLAAAREHGFDASPEWDFDGARQENAAGFYQKHIVDGRRQSVADAFLIPALWRPNLMVWTDTIAAAVEFDGSRASGVAVIRNGARAQARARREVIVAAGAIESPKLLMLSGIGPADQLRRHDIAVRADRPDVGANLQDHPRVGVRWESRQPLAASSVSAGLFTRSGVRADPAPPDLQFYVGRGLSEIDRFITLTVAVTQVDSRGRVELRSKDPLVAPAIHARYFTEPRDLEAMLAGVKLARSLAGSRAFETLRGALVAPPAGTPTDAELRAFIQSTSETMFHPAGTCRMGHDAASVVDPELRVRGVEGLRVADASIMPVVVNAQINAACVMIGERAANLIRG